MPFNLPCAQQHTNSQWKQENITTRLPNYVSCIKSRMRDHNAHACSQWNGKIFLYVKKYSCRNFFFSTKNNGKSPPTNSWRLQALKIMTQYILTLAWFQVLAVHLGASRCNTKRETHFLKLNCRKVGGTANASCRALKTDLSSLSFSICWPRKMCR